MTKAPSPSCRTSIIASVLTTSSVMTTCAWSMSEENQPSFEITMQWTAPGGEEERLFGCSVAIDGDFVAIRTDRGEDGSLVPGSVHLYNALEHDQAPVQTIRAPDRAWPDAFGDALAFSGDSLLVGAPADAEHGWDSGAAWLHHLEQGAWVLRHRFEPQVPEGGSRFGESVAYDGSVVVIGAPRSNAGAMDCGAVHVFERIAGSWIATSVLVAPDADEADFFGASVALHGHWIAVGAWGDDDNGEKTGSVWLFRKIGEEWLPMEKLVPGNGRERDRFGCTVAFASGELLVGASGCRDNSGAVHVYREVRGRWIEGDRLVDPEGRPGDWFGFTLSARGTLLIVGSPGADGATSLEGRIGLFHRVRDGWRTLGFLDGGPSDGEQAVQFGWTVATDGRRAVVGRMDDVDGPPAAGSAWLIERSHALVRMEQRPTAISHP